MDECLPDAEPCPDALFADVPRPDALFDGDVRSAELLADVLFDAVACSDTFLDDVLLVEDTLFVAELLAGLPAAEDVRRGSLSAFRPALISAAVSERIFCSIASIEISSASSVFFRPLPPPMSRPHLWQNFVPSRSTTPQSGHLISFITLVPHFGQNWSVSISPAPHSLHIMPVSPRYISCCLSLWQS